VDVSIVVRTKDEAKCIGQTLKRLREQEFDGSYEIVVVDSGSRDSTLDIAENYNVRIVQIPESEFTYGRSLNIGVEKAEGIFIANLSAHALPKNEKWLTHLIGGFEEHAVAGVYGRQVAEARLNPFEAMQNEEFFGLERIKFSLRDEDMLKYIHFSNSNCAIKRSIWEKFRFNESAPYAEDMLWQKKVIGAGYSVVYAPDAEVYHTHSVDIGNAYRGSRDCAYSLGLMSSKKQSISMVPYDLGICLSWAAISFFQNMRYIWENGYYEHLGTAPLYVISGWLGWLVGRIKYRLDR
jgi:rhamnosyltransferase